MPLGLVVEQHDVEVVAEAAGDRLDRGVATHPRAPQIGVVGQVEGDVVAARDEAVGELEHAPDSAEARQMGLDETKTHAPPRIRHEHHGTVSDARDVRGERA